MAFLPTLLQFLYKLVSIFLLYHIIILIIYTYHILKNVECYGPFNLSFEALIVSQTYISFNSRKIYDHLQYSAVFIGVVRQLCGMVRVSASMPSKIQIFLSILHSSGVQLNGLGLGLAISQDQDNLGHTRFGSGTDQQT